MTSSKSSHWAAKHSDAAAFRECNIGIGYSEDTQPEACNPVGVRHRRKKEEAAYGTLLYGDAGSAPQSGTAGRDQKVNFQAFKSSQRHQNTGSTKIRQKVYAGISQTA